MTDLAREARTMRPSLGGWVMVGILLALTIALTWRGYGFYLLDLDARIDHPDFRVLGPGELIGHGYGVVGTALMFTNLLYLVRRRLARWPLGPMSFWLSLHVVTGLVGSLLVVFHSAFQMRTAIASVTSGSLLLVVVTGVIGRYLYALSPRLEVEEVEEQLQILDDIAPGVRDQVEARLVARPVLELPGNAGLGRVLRTVPAWVAQWRARRRDVRQVGNAALLAVDPADRPLYDRALSRAVWLAGAEVRVTAARALLRTWRGLHRFLALTMLVTVAIHIAVAWFYGYRWLLGE